MRTLDPQFLTVLADHDGHARWVATIQNYDTGGKSVAVLITLFSDGTIHLATKPGQDLDCTWSPPAEADRS